MADRIVSLSIASLFDGNHNHPGIPAFIEEFSDILYSGDGKKPQMLERLGIDRSFPVRLLVGIPAKLLTWEQKRIAEAYCSMIFGLPLGDSKGLWAHNKGWKPVNPGRIAAPIKDCDIDREWMLTLGIQKPIWNGDILLAPTAIPGQPKRLPATVIRHFLALVAFGFSDPDQFFTKATAEEAEN